MRTFKRGWAGLSAGVGVGLSVVSSWGQATLTVIDRPSVAGEFAATGLSGDGSTFFGWNQVSGSGAHLFRWRAGLGFEDLGRPIQLGSISDVFASGSGEAVAFSIHLDDTDRMTPVKWTVGGGFELLPLTERYAHRTTGISPDGRWVVGYASGTAAVVWPPAGGVEMLPLFPGYQDSSTAGVSDEGAVVGNVFDRESRADLVFWPAEGKPASFGVRPGLATLASGDVSVVVGPGIFRSTARVTRLLTPGVGLSPTALSGDGAVVFASLPGASSPTPNIWTAASGWTPVADWLSAGGLGVAAWTNVRVVGASDDGRTILATGRHLGSDRLFVAHVDSLPPPDHCPADWDYNGDVNSADFFAFVSHFFLGAGDFDESGDTSSQDLFDFLGAFFAGC